MFTGLVSARGTVRHIEQQGDLVIEIAAPSLSPKTGDSIACDGICLTVTELTADGFIVQLSAETLGLTTARNWKVGDSINLEPALAHGDKLGGHYVSGHVDGQAIAIASEKSGDSVVWTFEAPESLMRFIAPKGSVTLDGVSLTVNTVEKNLFSVNIIPHTQAATGFGSLQLLDKVNLEIDMLARYAARAQETA
jgi:riboflavin synthase